MAKNRGFNETQRQVNETMEQSQRRAADMDAFLKSIFGPNYERSLEMIEDAYGKYGDLYGKYGDFATTGGIDPQGQEARDFYSGLMKTGGFDEKQKQEFRARSLAPTRGFWDAFKREQEQRTAINPYSSGASAGAMRSARQAAFDVGERGIGAETELSSQIRQGRQAGAAGAAGMWGQVASNRLAGLGGQMGATGGIASLGNATADRAMGIINNMLQNAQLDAQTRTALLNLKAQMNPRTSTWDRIMQIAGLVTRGAAAYATGGGSEAARFAGQGTGSRYQPFDPNMFNPPNAPTTSNPFGY